MTTAQRLKQNLLKTGVYDSDAAELNRELMAYAAETERLYADLGVLFRERFIATAEDEGLAAYERLFGPERTDECTADRREMLSLRMNLGGGDFTPSGIRRALDSFGLAYTLSEFPHIGKLTVVADTDYSQAQQEWIRREVEKIIPAHIEFQLSFNTLTWAQWDALDRTFQEADAEDQTWRQIDNRKQE